MDWVNRKQRTPLNRKPKPAPPAPPPPPSPPQSSSSYIVLRSGRAVFTKGESVPEKSWDSDPSSEESKPKSSEESEPKPSEESEPESEPKPSEESEPESEPKWSEESEPKWSEESEPKSSESDQRLEADSDPVPGKGVFEADEESDRDLGPDAEKSNPAEADVVVAQVAPSPLYYAELLDLFKEKERLTASLQSVELLIAKNENELKVVPRMRVASYFELDALVSMVRKGVWRGIVEIPREKAVQLMGFFVLHDALTGIQYVFVDDKTD